MTMFPKFPGFAPMVAVPGLTVLLWCLSLGGPAVGQAWGQTPPPENPMREMLRRMMPGVVPPPGMTLERLPEPSSGGARVMARYCAQCHDLPSPRYKTAVQWLVVFSRMLDRMQMMKGQGETGRGMMGMGKISAPTTAEVRILLGYLRKFAMVAATPAELGRGNPTGRAIFQAVCSRCHVPPSPSLHPPAEWAAVVARMEGNMGLMKKPAIGEPERVAINRFLGEAAAKPR